MGVVFTVGLSEDDVDEEVYEWTERDLGQINVELARLGIPEYPVPGSWEPPVEQFQLNSGGVPYDMLHALRLTFAGAHAQPGESGQEALDRLTDEFTSHLVSHSDADGMYLPVEFGRPVPVASIREIVGSSQRLLSELSGLSTHFGIELDRNGALSPAAVERVTSGQVERGDDLECWLQLYDAARVSVACGLPLIFQ